MSLLVASASPALADPTPLALSSTGMVDGQRVGVRLAIHPVWTGAVTSVEVAIAGRTTTVTVDNTKPTLTITKAPKNKAKVAGTVKIGASASDRNGVNRVELLINGKLVAKDVTSGYSFSINSKSYGKTIKMQLRAYDRAGNVTYTTARTWRR